MYRLVEVIFTGVISEMWSMRDPFLVSKSAVSLSLIPQCGGIYFKAITLSLLCRKEIILWHSIVLELLSPDMAWKATLEFERSPILLNISSLFNKFFIVLQILLHQNLLLLFRNDSLAILAPSDGEGKYLSVRPHKCVNQYFKMKHKILLH